MRPVTLQETCNVVVVPVARADHDAEAASDNLGLIETDDFHSIH